MARWQRWLLGIGVTLAVSLLALATASAYLLSGLFTRPPWLVHRSPEQGLVPLAGNPWAVDALQGVLTNPRIDLGLPYEKVEFPTAEEATLRGWYVPGPSSTTIVTVHGGGGDRREFLRMVPALHDAGYSLLLFDCRETGVSDGRGRGISLGVREHEDVLAAVQYVRSSRGADRVAVLGGSVGAVSSILAAARSQEIDAVIAEAPAASLESWVPHMLRSRISGILADLYADGGSPGLQWVAGFDPPDWWIGWVVRMLRWRIGAGPEFNPIHAVAEIAPRPLLLMHGDADLMVPVEAATRLFERAGEPKELWIVPGGEHLKLFNIAPERWRSRVVGFLTRHLPPGGESLP